MYSLSIPRIAVPADGHRDPVRQLKTVRRPPIYPNGAQAISPAAPSPPFRCPHAVHRWIRAYARPLPFPPRREPRSPPSPAGEVARSAGEGETSPRPQYPTPSVIPPRRREARNGAISHAVCPNPSPIIGEGRKRRLAPLTRPRGATTTLPPPHLQRVPWNPIMPTPRECAGGELLTLWRG